MADPLTMMTLAYGTKALGDAVQGGFQWASANKMSKKTPAEQARLSYLKKLANEGAIPPDQQSRLLSLANRPAFNISNTAKANMMGNLTNQGLENSVVAIENDSNNKLANIVVEAKTVEGSLLDDENGSIISSIIPGCSRSLKLDLSSPKSETFCGRKVSWSPPHWQDKTGKTSNFIDDKIKNLLRTALKDKHTFLGVGSGDNFVEDKTNYYGEVVDMEAYALAKVCYKRQVPFISFKYITDGADEQAHEDWEANLAQGIEEFHKRVISKID